MKKLLFILVFSLSATVSKAGFLDNIIGIIGSALGFQQTVFDGVVDTSVSQYWLFEQMQKGDVTNNQKEIKDLQRIIDQRIDSLTRLEQKTIDYLSETQEEAIDNEDFEDIIEIASDIVKNQSECAKMVVRCPELAATAAKLDAHCVLRGQRIINKIKDFAKIDGIDNMLDNKERDDIILMVIDDLKDMRSMSNYVVATLRAAEKKRYLENNL